VSASPDDAAATGGTAKAGEEAAEVLEQAAELLAECTEAGRLARARKLVDKVTFAVADDELIIAAVANYNVVVDVTERRIQHGCRDFRGQASERRLCKHVAATLLALEPRSALAVAGELAEGARAPASGVVVPWRFEAITRFTPGG
jgi:hypothetical protein